MTDSCLQGLTVYLVGGAVRDELMELPAGDRDWVVVGADPDSMVKRGFIPVGDDFPVFLHPTSHEEYALARTERKSGHGYKGFTFYAGKDVSLEQDLSRRDLTINAIAKDINGSFIDPLKGRLDIEHKILRHIGNAFVEDPVRLLRLARFAARFSDFVIAQETLDLCFKLVDSGELDALVPERVWQEFAKGLMTNQPSRMLDVLQKTGALAKVAPNLNWDKKYADVLNRSATKGFDLPQRYALMCFWSASKVKLLAPSACLSMAGLLPKIIEQIKLIQHINFGSTLAIQEFGPLLRVFELADAFRKPDRFMSLVNVAALLIEIVDISIWQRQLDALLSIDAGAIAKKANGDVAVIKQNIKLARLKVLADSYN